jgi:K+-sensing histidine kinase KdpD
VQLTALGRLLGSIAVAILGIAAATGIIAALEHGLGVPNAAAVYLVAVSAVAIAVGTGGAVLGP